MLRLTRWMLCVGAAAGVLLVPSTGSARVAKNPCHGGPWQLVFQGGHAKEYPVWGYTMDGHTLSTEYNTARQLYDKHPEYRYCAEKMHIPWILTWDSAVECAPGFKLAGTSGDHWNMHTAHWDYWTRDGKWILWDGRGHFTTYTHDGVRFASGFDGLFHNWGDAPFQPDGQGGLEHNWPMQMFATCDRIPGYYRSVGPPGGGSHAAADAARRGT
jgi:hypothetical protein